MEPYQGRIARPQARGPYPWRGCHSPTRRAYCRVVTASPGRRRLVNRDFAGLLAMFNPDAGGASVYKPSFETAARVLKVELIPAPVHSDAEIEMAINALGREPGGGLVVVPGGLQVTQPALIISAPARNNVPAVYALSAFARDGGLLSYGPDYLDQWPRAASYVDRILRGAKPGDLPVQFPTKFEMVVNLKTAKALGLAIPPSILLRADERIE